MQDIRERHRLAHGTPPIPSSTMHGFSQSEPRPASEPSVGVLPAAREPRRSPLPGVYHDSCEIVDEPSGTHHRLVRDGLFLHGRRDCWASQTLLSRASCCVRSIAAPHQTLPRSHCLGVAQKRDARQAHQQNRCIPSRVPPIRSSWLPCDPQGSQ